MSETAESRTGFSERSAAGVLIGSLALIATGALCGALGVNETIAQGATAAAGAVPAVIALVMNRRRRSPEDVARIRSGQQDRPIGLIVFISAAALLIYDTVVGLIVGTMLELPLIPLILSLAATVPVFFAAAWLRRFLGARAVLWVSVIVGVAFVMRAFIVGTVLPNLGAGDVLGELLVYVFVYYLLFLAAALAGAWYGRRRRVAPTRSEGHAAPAAALSNPSLLNVAEPDRLDLHGGQDSGAAAASIGAPLVEKAVPPGRPPEPPPSPTPPAGWYPDPQLRGVERWWDGAEWTEHRRNTP